MPRTSKTRYLWATTHADLVEIRIYVDPQLKGCWAETDIISKGHPFITMHPDCLNSPEVLDEILMHEFVHCLEYMFEADLKKPDPKHCTQYAIIIGRHMPRIFKYLKQVDNEQGLKKAKGNRNTSRRATRLH